MEFIRVILLLLLLMNGFKGHSQIFNLRDSVLHVGDSLVRDVYFYYNASRILKESFPFLDSLADFMTTNDSLTIEIGVYTSYLGNEEYNLKLSEHRARSILWYLRNKGVPNSKLHSKGYGEKHLITSESEIKSIENKQKQLELHAINNRVVFTIVRIN